MKTFGDLNGRDVRWVQPNLIKHTFELRTLDGEVVARFKRSGLINEVDDVEAAGGQWRIAHKGNFTRRFEIRAAGGVEGEPMYVFQHSDGSLKLPDGHVVYWKKVGEPKDKKWQWLSSTGKRLLTLTSGDGTHINAQIRLDLGAAVEGTRLLLVLLGCYLILLYSDEAE